MTAKKPGRAQRLKVFFAALADAPESVLMLDYDGTLAPFRIKPDRATPYPGVRSILKRILKIERTRVVLISGRWTRDLIPLLRLDPLPEIWGSHGWERRHADGRYEIFPFDERALRGLAEADRWVEKMDLGDRSEQKPGCLALHWRGLGRQKTAGARDRIAAQRVRRRAGTACSGTPQGGRGQDHFAGGRAGCRSNLPGRRPHR
jgi:trehalose 6-phosphate phosphatase